MEKAVIFNADTVRSRCNGMLSVSVYSKVYEFARFAPKGSFVEVGTAHGAATVTLGAALLETESDHLVYSFEKIVGGSREEFGSVEENKKIIRDNIEAFGLDDVIRLTFGDVSSEHGAVPEDERISLLMLDADGKIDRDFAYFFDRLVPEARIIIDDVSPDVRVKCRTKTLEVHDLRIDQKHRITHLLIEKFQHHGLIKGEIHESTFFGVKQPGSNYSSVSHEIIGCYHELVFADARYYAVPGGLLGAVKRLIARFLPASVVQRLRVFYYGKP
jgi:predicted O-methyltransferase YrrM